MCLQEADWNFSRAFKAFHFQIRNSSPNFLFGEDDFLLWTFGSFWIWTCPLMWTMRCQMQIFLSFSFLSPSSLLFFFLLFFVLLLSSSFFCCPLNLSCLSLFSSFFSFFLHFPFLISFPFFLLPFFLSPFQRIILGISRNFHWLKTWNFLHPVGSFTAIHLSYSLGREENTRSHPWIQSSIYIFYSYGHIYLQHKTKSK